MPREESGSMYIRKWSFNYYTPPPSLYYTTLDPPIGCFGRYFPNPFILFPVQRHINLCPCSLPAWLTPVFMQLVALTFQATSTFVAFSCIRSSTIPFSVPYSLAFVLAWAFILRTITPKGSATPALGKPFVRDLRNSQLFHLLSFIDLCKKLSSSVKDVMWMNAHKWWFQPKEGKKKKRTLDIFNSLKLLFKTPKNYAWNQNCTLVLT